MDKDLRMIAFLFDSGQISNLAYGDYVFDLLLKGGELKQNKSRMIVSVGDIVSFDAVVDLYPFVIKDNICSVENGAEPARDLIFAIMIEDIELDRARSIDVRLKGEVVAYRGMTSIDINSKDCRKQFWKLLIRMFSIEKEEIIYFGDMDHGFGYQSIADRYGYNTQYDSSVNDYLLDELPASQQSSFVVRQSQFAIVDGIDMDRGRLEMNFALVQEVEIAGVQIWKAIEDIDHVYISDNMPVDYIFMSLYQAAQGIERLLKISIELVIYGKANFDKSRVNDLLYSHNHCELIKYLQDEGVISVTKGDWRLLNLLMKFYTNGRYSRYKYSRDRQLEVKMIREFAGKDISGENFDGKLKKLYGQSLGKLSRKLYATIEKLSSKHNIFVYELHVESVAKFVFYECYNENLYGLLKEIQQSKKEFIWFLLKYGQKLLPKEFRNKYSSLNFECAMVQEYLHELISNENSGDRIYEYVSTTYDDMVCENKESWKKRIAFISLLGDKSFVI